MLVAPNPPTAFNGFQEMEAIRITFNKLGKLNERKVSRIIEKGAEAPLTNNQKLGNFEITMRYLVKAVIT